jgi:hypothetical protein
MRHVGLFLILEDGGRLAYPCKKMKIPEKKICEGK